MRKIGITGGIGSGKSYVCNLFKQQGFAVYDSDARAKALMVEDSLLRAAITEAFGTESYLADGTLNRPFLAGSVFKDADKLKLLNSLVHPAVARDTERWFAETETHISKPFALKEAAILFESGADKGLDGVIVVTAPEAIRIARVMQRDGPSHEQVLKRMAQQMPEAARVARASFIIYNDGIRALDPQVAEAILHFSK